MLLSKCDSSDDRNLSLAEVIEIKLHLLSLFSDRTTYEGFDIPIKNSEKTEKNEECKAHRSVHNKNKDDNTYVGLKRRKIQVSGYKADFFFQS